VNKFWLLTILQQLSINGSGATQREIFISIKVSKEIALFQQACIRINNLRMRCKKWFNWTVRVRKKIWLQLL